MVQVKLKPAETLHSAAYEIFHENIEHYYLNVLYLKDKNMS
jgi:hypothetical protein